MSRLWFGLFFALAGSASAMVPGGSGPRPDCYSEFDGIDVTNPGSLPPRVECTDGDPACDHDGACGNGFCVFRIRLCINQHDPALPICRPPLHGLTSLHVLPQRFAGLATGLDLGSSACGAFVDVPVEIRRGGLAKPGRLPLRVFARSGATPAVDKDQVFLVCNPRRSGESCPPPGASTTTTVPPATTTTTSVPAITTTSTTTAPPTTTSTTAPAPSTTTTSISTTSSSTTTTSSTSSTTATTAPPTTTTLATTTTTTPLAITTTTAPIVTTTTVLPATTTTAPVATTTTTLATTTTVPAPTTTTSSTSSTSTTHTTTTTSTTTSSTTTSTVATTTTSTSTSTTTTTVAGLSSCPAGGQVDVITKLVPGPNTFNSSVILGLEVDLGYPSSVSMPGTQFLPVNDPADPTTLIALLSADFNGVGINLYNGSPTFFDADGAPPLTLKTLLSLAPEANLIFNQVVPFERARFTCTAGTALSAASFTCAMPSEVDVISRTIPVDQRPACVVTLAAP